MDTKDILERIPFGVVVWKAQGPDPADLVLEYANGMTAEESGFDARTIVGQRMGDALPAAIDFWGRTFLEVLAGDVPATREASFGDERHPNRVHRVHMTPLGDDRLLVLNENVTEVKEAEAQLASSVRELERFAGAVAHDLKSPLTSMYGFADLVLRTEDVLSPDSRGMLERVRENALRAGRMIDDLLDFARTAGPTGERQVVDLADVVSWVGDVLSDDIRELNAALVTDALPVVEGNPSALRQVFLNLISNAVKYRQPGTSPYVSVTGVRSVDDRAVIEVTDHGVGVPRDMRESIFELGTRVHHGSHAAVEGSGIGLATCRVVVERHGGSIEMLEGPGGVGSTVRLVLPAWDGERIAEPEADPPAGLTVAAIDDDLDTLRLLRDAAAGAGLTWLGDATGPSEGREMLRRLDRDPDVIIVDYRMAGTDGIAFARELLQENPRRRVIMYSSHVDAELRQAASDAGIAACVRKQDTADIAVVIRSLMRAA